MRRLGIETADQRSGKSVAIHVTGKVSGYGFPPG
jgi:hypothetical protein